MTELSYGRLSELLTYNPETGVFRWKIARGRSRAGGPAGNVDKSGYVMIRLDKRLYAAHRLAWRYVHGLWPPHGALVDHINMDRADNRIANLRLATHSQNKANRAAPVTNTTGYKGVWFDKRRGKFVAALKVEGTTKHIGYFTLASDAHDAYKQAAREYFGEFARG